MIRSMTFAGLSLVLVAACDMPQMPMASTDAADTTPVAAAAPMTAKERFVASAESNGCVVSEATAPAILSGATLSEEDLARIMTELISEGRGNIAADGKSFVVVSDNCA